jgi:hypothetical protein
MGQLTNQEACALTDTNRPARVRLFDQAPAGGSCELRDFLQRSVAAFDSVPRSFTAGDVRRGSAKRLATAVGEGSMAVTFIQRHLAETAFITQSKGARS